MLFAEVARVSGEIARTSARTRKTALLAEFFRAAEPEDVPVAIAYLSGRLPQGRLGVGWSALRDRARPAEEATLTVAGVDAALTAVRELTGTGSQSARRSLLQDLFGAATDREQRYLLGLLTGEVRQGALDAAAAEGLAAATGAPAADVRRAVMLAGGLEPVARALLARGRCCRCWPAAPRASRRRSASWAPARWRRSSTGSGCRCTGSRPWSGSTPAPWTT
jgi:DNA ligase-1